jgi:hypothetical protein
MGFPVGAVAMAFSPWFFDCGKLFAPLAVSPLAGPGAEVEQLIKSRRSEIFNLAFAG